MKRIIVIGCPGGGKSTFSIALGSNTGIPVYHLDMMFWNADKTTVEKSVFLERLAQVMKKDEWIIDGNYASTMEQRLCACDTVFFLDYPVDVCLDGALKRRGIKRPDMPWVETEDDAEFLGYIKRFNKEVRPTVIELLKSYKEKDIFVFKNRNEASEFLEKSRNM